MAATSSTAQVQFPDFTALIPEAPTPEEMQAFRSKAAACFAEIKKTSYDGSGTQPLQKKYNDLKALRSRIRTVQKKFPQIEKAAFTTLAKSVSHEMHKLQRRFETNSHWLVMTQHKTHFKEIKPAISKSSQPKLKLNPNDLTASFDNIGELERPLEKLRGLQKLTRMIQSEIEKLEGEKKKEGLTPEQEDLLDAKIDSWVKKLGEVEVFAEKCVPFQDLFLAIKQIYWVDKDAEQDKELTDLLDKTGRNHALTLLKPSIPVDQLVSFLTALLNDRHTKNPTKQPLTFLLTWPALAQVTGQYPEYQHLQGQSLFVDSVLKGLANLKSEDPKRRLVCEYLLNMIDPTGMIRIQWYQARKLPFAKMCQEVAKIKESLLMFGLKTDHFEAHVKFQQASPDKKPPLTSLEMLARMKAGKAASGEIEMLAKVLKHYTVMVFRQAGHQGFQEAFKASGLKVGKEFAEEKLTAYFISALKSCQEEKEQINLMKAIVQLTIELVRCGEFTISFSLIHSLLDNYDVRHAFPKAAESIKHSKEMKFLESLFDVTSNNKNLRAFIADRTKKQVLCLPYVHLVGKTFTMFNQGEENLVDQIKELIKSTFAGTMDALYLQLGKRHQKVGDALDEETLKALGKSKMLSDWDVLLDCLKKFDPEKFESIKAKLIAAIAETEEQRQMRELYASDIRTSIWALECAHSTDHWKEMLSKTDLIEVIESTHVP